MPYFDLNDKYLMHSSTPGNLIFCFRLPSSTCSTFLCWLSGACVHLPQIHHVKVSIHVLIGPLDPYGADEQLNHKFCHKMCNALLHKASGLPFGKFLLNGSWGHYLQSPCAMTDCLCPRKELASSPFSLFCPPISQLCQTRIIGKLLLHVKSW